MSRKRLQKYGLLALILSMCTYALFTLANRNTEDAPTNAYGNEIIPVSTISPDTRYISLTTRNFSPSMSTDYDTEQDSVYNYFTTNLSLDHTALLLVDVWKYHLNDGFLRRMETNRETHLVPLLELARANNMTIIHLPNGQIIADDCQPIGNEPVIRGKASLTSYLNQRGITTLIYAGYASNWCLINRDTGIFEMFRDGYNIILMRDCVLAFETPETLDGEWANKVIVNIIGSWIGCSTTLEDLRYALEN